MGFMMQIRPEVLKKLRGNPHCTFAVNFRCYPFFYADAAAAIPAACTPSRSSRCTVPETLRSW